MASKAQSWVNMDAVKIRKKSPAAAYPFSREDEVMFRREAVRALSGKGDEALSFGAARFGARDCIYWVRMLGTDTYKIGYTFHMGQRLSALRAGTPLPLECVSWVSFFDERYLGEAEHFAHRFAGTNGKRVKGEWFVLSEENVRKGVSALADELRPHVMGVSHDGLI